MPCMEPRTLRDLASTYILRCEVEGKSPFTVSAYRWTLARFISAMEEERAPAEANAVAREHLYAYLGRFTGHSADTLHRSLLGLWVLSPVELVVLYRPWICFSLADYP